ncbi:hypothetical protein FACS1894190_02720 [Spirochaetia bacterium]|nr:hypothetical protein FACS1894190_02720 [Spirochaetia bacterium]
MASYYFLIAQLPQLAYGQTPSITSEAFIELARRYLEKHDAELLNFCTLGTKAEAPPPTSSEFINLWRKRERTLTFNLAQVRAAKIKRDGVQVNYEIERDDLDTENQAKAAVAMEDPLEAELFLDKGRWEAIENFIGITYFDVNVVYAYLLKLLLIERRLSFKTEEGFAEYKSLYASIMESAPQVGAAGDI